MPKTQTKQTPEEVFDAFVDQLLAGNYDERLNEVGEEIRERRSVMKAARTLEARQRLRKGMIVRVKHDAALRPKYILGHTLGPITAVRTAKAEVEVLHPIGRFVGGTIVCPLDSLEEVKP